ncbi:MAG: hypothetical protein DIU76_11270 [Bacillota bacterium]|nr:MAG: hypothetical protein DIU76_11270 [Bacillota bacterium]
MPMPAPEEAATKEPEAGESQAGSGKGPIDGTWLILQRLEDLRRQQDGLERRLEALESRIETRWDALAQRMDALEARMEARLGALAQRMDTLEARFREFGQRFDALEGRVASLQQRVEGIETRLEVQGTELRNLGTLMASLADEQRWMRRWIVGLLASLVLAIAGLALGRVL